MVNPRDIAGERKKKTKKRKKKKTGSAHHTYICGTNLIIVSYTYQHISQVV